MVNQRTVKLLAVGDIMLGRLMSKMVSRKGFPYPFEHVLDHLKGDVVFGNLESPLSNSGMPNVLCKPSDPLFRGDPAMAKTLRRAGFTVLSLANNHMFDYGFDAFKDTAEALSKAGIVYVGSGANLAESRLLQVVEARDLKIGFLAYTYAYPADSSRPGCAPMIPKIMRIDIHEARSKVDVLVVSLHHGIEYVDYPTPWMREIARRAVMWGANLVLGHHPHTLQGIEVYGNSLIAYSLGNFVFDSVDREIRAADYARTEIALNGKVPVSVDDLRTIESVILECELSTHGVESYHAIPIRIGEDFQPRIALEEEGEGILKRLYRISQPLLDLHHPIWEEMKAIQEAVRELSLSSLSLIEALRMFPHLRLHHLKSFVPYLRVKAGGSLRKVFGKK